MSRPPAQSERWTSPRRAKYAERYPRRVLAALEEEQKVWLDEHLDTIAALVLEIHDLALTTAQRQRTRIIARELLRKGIAGHSTTSVAPDGSDADAA